MALFHFQAQHSDAESTMNTEMMNSRDETTPDPETAGRCEEPADPRQLAPECDDRDPEEAGYGYGV
jgi:hypothetical protein